MYIELAGTPGAGKTALTEAVREELLRRGAPCITRATFFSPERGKVYKLLWTIFRLHYLDKTSVRFLFSLYRHQQIGIRRTVRTVHEYLKLCYLLAQQGRSVHIVWDGGFVQRFANVISAGIADAEVVAAFVKQKMPGDALVVFVDTPIDVAAERRYEREVRLKKAAGASVPREEGRTKEILKERKRAQEEVFALLERHAIRTVTLDGQRPIEENVRYLCELIEGKSV